MPSSKFVVAVTLAVLAAGAAVRGEAREGAAGLPQTGTAGSFDAAIERARSLEPLQSLLVSQDGTIVVEESFRGHSPRAATNIKSASKSVISALVGIAIERGLLEGADQPIADILRDAFPADPDPRLDAITIGNLLSMQAGLERTSGRNYGAWIASPNWVRAVLARPFVDAPGGAMLYSTGNSHLLSAILTKASGRSTLALLNEWLGPAGVAVESWERDPQGIHLGGNEMAMTPRSLLAFGELYRNGGRAPDGRQIVPADWIAQSWTPRTRSRFSGESYGYGWFMRRLGSHQGWFGWGFGGQMIYVLPDLELTIAITSSTAAPAGRTGYKDDLHRLVAETIVPAAEQRMASGTGADDDVDAEPDKSSPAGEELGEEG